VVPYQCLGCVWSQRDKKDNMSPTIRATIAQFNAVTNRVISALLCCPGPAAAAPPRGAPPAALLRARVIEMWIKVAQVPSGRVGDGLGFLWTSRCVVKPVLLSRVLSRIAAVNQKVHISKRTDGQTDRQTD